MADFTMKANDLLPVFQATLKLNGTVVDLTNATSVSFIMRAAAAGKPLPGSPKINKPAEFVGLRTAGGVRYSWVAGDTDLPNTYVAEWEVIWADGKPQTFPTLTYHSIDILADLDGAA